MMSASTTTSLPTTWRAGKRPPSTQGDGCSIATRGTLAAVSALFRDSGTVAGSGRAVAVNTRKPPVSSATICSGSSRSPTGDANGWKLPCTPDSGIDAGNWAGPNAVIVKAARVARRGSALSVRSNA